MTVVSWKGIPYAAAPVGDLRWRAPQPIAFGSVPAPGGDFGPSCPQAKNPAIAFGDNKAQDERCLTLNVWRGDQAGGPLPVMLWLHGGAYVFGGSAQPLYDGTTLAETGEVVVVTANYRLGGFGFLELGEDFDSNLALRDAIASLEWVRDHIAEFGGDPTCVTIFGESAGAGMVSALMASPLAKGLFHGAIAQSSPLTSMYSDVRAAEVVREFRDAASSGVDTENLCDLSPEQIVEISMKLFADVPDEHPGTLAFAPVVGDEVLPEHPIDVFAGGRAHDVPLLIGTNRDEASLFKFMKSPLLPIDDERLTAMFEAILAERPETELPTRDEVLAAYAAVGHRALGPSVARDVGFRMPSLWAADGHSAKAPTYVYRFDHSTPMLRAIGLGAAHGTEVMYVFGNLDLGRKDITFKLGGKKTGQALSERMRSHWRAFATQGDPGWPAYTREQRGSQVFDKEDRYEADLDAALFKTWGSSPVSFE